MSFLQEGGGALGHPNLVWILFPYILQFWEEDTIGKWYQVSLPASIYFTFFTAKYVLVQMEDTMTLWVVLARWLIC